METEEVITKLKEVGVYLPRNSGDITMLHHKAGSLEIGARYLSEDGKIITTQQLVLTHDNRDEHPDIFTILDELGLPEHTIEDEPDWAPL